MKTPIKNNLKALRIQHHYFQSQVAILLSLDCLNRISRWEHGTSLPSVINLFKLAQLFGVLPHELYPELFSELSQKSQ